MRGMMKGGDERVTRRNTGVGRRAVKSRGRGRRAQTDGREEEAESGL